MTEKRAVLKSIIKNWRTAGPSESKKAHMARMALRDEQILNARAAHSMGDLSTAVALLIEIIDAKHKAGL